MPPERFSQRNGIMRTVNATNRITTNAAKAMIEITETEKPPLRLLLGVAALKGARAKLEELKNDFDTWAATSEGADFKKE